MKLFNHIISGSIGALIIILVGVVIYAWIAPIDYAPIYMINPNTTLDPIISQDIDSIRCEHISALRDLETKGVLLNPAEYTSHIADFYNGLIAFLIGIFVIFSVGGIYLMRSTNKIELEEFKQNITNKTQAHIRNQLSVLLNDSISFKETIVSALYGRLEDDIVTTDKLDAIESSIEKIQGDIEFLYESIGEIEENLASKEIISNYTK